MVAIVMVHQWSLEYLINPRYEGMWEEVAAYNLSKFHSPDKDGQLKQRFGNEAFEYFFSGRSGNLVFLPSEEAAQASCIGLLLEEEETHFFGRVNQFWAVLVLFFYPILFSLRTTMHWLGSIVYRKGSAEKALSEYVTAERDHRLARALNTVVLVLGISIFIGWHRWEPQYGEVDISRIELALMTFFHSLVQAVWMTTVTLVVHFFIIGTGRNPYYSMIDEFIVVLITFPLLLFVYGNSLASIGSGAVAALAGGWWIKIRLRRSRIPRS